MQKALKISEKPDAPKPAQSKPKSSTKPKRRRQKKEKLSESETDTDTTEDDVNDIKIELPQLQTQSSQSTEFIQNLPQDDLSKFNDIYTACSTNNSTKLHELLENKRFNKNLLNKRLNRDKGYTLLHKTSELGNAECVWILLMNDADISIKEFSKNELVPYQLCQSKQVKDQYRRFRYDFPDKHDYENAKVPEPISEEQLNSKAEKEKEKKKVQKLKKKQREAEMKSQDKIKEIENLEIQRWLSLSDAEKRALKTDRNFSSVPQQDSKKDYESKLTKEQKERLFIAERRAAFFDKAAGQIPTTTQAPRKTFTVEELKNLNRCWMCGVDISKVLPFEYSTFKFCSTPCLSSHRQRK